PDFTESKVTGLDRDSYDPAHTADAARQGNPVVKNVDGRGFDLSGVIDPQVKYGFAFDDNKNANWSQDKSNAGVGGFSGAVKGLGSPSSSHPKRGLIKRDTL